MLNPKEIIPNDFDGVSNKWLAVSGEASTVIERGDILYFSGFNARPLVKKYYYGVLDNPGFLAVALHTMPPGSRGHIVFELIHTMETGEASNNTPVYVDATGALIIGSIVEEGQLDQAKYVGLVLGNNKVFLAPVSSGPANMNTATPFNSDGTDEEAAAASATAAAASADAAADSATAADASADAAAAVAATLANGVADPGLLAYFNAEDETITRTATAEFKAISIKYKLVALNTDGVPIATLSVKKNEVEIFAVNLTLLTVNALTEAAVFATTDFAIDDDLVVEVVGNVEVIVTTIAP